MCPETRSRPSRAAFLIHARLFDMNTTRVAVMMPNYNNADYVAEAIESIKNQTHKDWHLYISDDGSTDTSVSIITNIIKDDERITLVQQPSNIGNPANRNALLKLAKHHELLAILDSDDIAKPERLEKQVAFFDTNTDIDLVGSHLHIIDTNGHLTGSRTFPLEKKGILKKFLSFNPVVQGACMFKSSIIGASQYDESLPRAEDYDFFIRLVLNGACPGNIDAFLTSYRIYDQDKYEKLKSGVSNGLKVRWKYKGSSLKNSSSLIALLKYILAMLVLKVLPEQTAEQILREKFNKRYDN